MSQPQTKLVRLFLALQGADGKPRLLYVNPSSIISVYARTDGGSTLCLNHGGSSEEYLIKGTPDQVALAVHGGGTFVLRPAGDVAVF